MRPQSHSKQAVLSLEILSQSSSDEKNQPTQFQTLVRHFLDRFFNNELMSNDGEAKARLVQMACVVGLPGFIMALYLYGPYHPPRGARSYWAQAGDHYFYVLYSFVACGILTLFAWDFFFPDLLDALVISTLPVQREKLMRARIAAMLILIAGFLADSNFLAPIVLPAATDPTHIFRFLFAHIIATAMSGIFGAAFFLALQGILLAVLGDRVFRKISLWVQGISVTVLLTILFLYPVVFPRLRSFIASEHTAAFYMPPCWFTGVYERLLYGPSVLPAFARLARIGWQATLLAAALTVVSYPLAYWRKTRGLIEGTAATHHQHRHSFIGQALHTTILRNPAGRAIWHFIGQTILGVPRYRVYMALYGGVGTALLISAALRVNIISGHMHFTVDFNGLTAAVPIAAFWTVSGLRTVLMSPAEQKATWVFRVVQGKAENEHLSAAKHWVLCWALIVSLATAAIVCWLADGGMPGLRFPLGQMLVAMGLSLLLTDVFSLHVKTIPFTHKPSSTTANFAFLLVPYVGFFPVIVLFTVSLEPWIEAATRHLIIAATIVVGLHLWLQAVHRHTITAHITHSGFDGEEEEFPLKLGLKY